MSDSFAIKILSGLALAMLLFAGGSGHAATTVLFQDAFTGPQSFDISSGIAEPGRQSGALVNVIGPTVGYTQSDMFSMGAYASQVAGDAGDLSDPDHPHLPGALSVSHWGGAGPNMNFNGDFSQGGFEMEFEMSVGPSLWDANAVGTIHIGFDSPYYTTTTPYTYAGGNNHFSLHLNNADGTSTFQGLIGNVGGDPTEVQATTNLPINNLIDGQLHKFKITATDTLGDNNPFDGSGETRITCWQYDDQAGSPSFGTYLELFTYVGDGAVYKNNYVYFGSYFQVNCDNLSISGNSNFNVWSQTGNAVWNPAVTGNWSNGVVPQAAGDVARFLGSNAAASTITATANVTVGTLELNSAQGYTLEAAPGVSITLDNTGNPNLDNAKIVAIGNHRITATLVQNSILDLTVLGHEDSLTIAQEPTGSLAFMPWNIKGGAGTVVVEYDFNWERLPVLSDAGVFELGSGGSVDLTGLTLTVPAGAGIGVATGGTITADSLSFNGALWLDGGNLVSSSPVKTTIDVGTLGLANRKVNTASYTSESGETITVNNLVGGTGTSTFHFDGGTVKNRAGANGTIQGLTHAIIDAGGAVIDGGTAYPTTSMTIGQSFEDGTAGPGIVNLNPHDNGWVVLASESLHSGGTNINGSVSLQYNGKFGTGLLNVADGANVMMGSYGATTTIDNDITLNGLGGLAGGVYDKAAIFGDAGSATNNLTGKIALAATSDIENYSGNHVMTLSGKITGAGGLVLGGRTYAGGEIRLSGSEGNDYAGDTTVIGQYTYLAKPGGAGGYAIPSTSVTIKGGPNWWQYGVVRLEGNEQINSAATLNTDSSVAWAIFELNGHTQTIKGFNITGTGNIKNISDAAGLPGPATLIVDDQGTNSSFNGYLYDGDYNIRSGVDTLSLVKKGTGTLTLSLAAAYTGNTDIEGGTLQFISNVNLTTVTGSDAGTLAVRNDAVLTASSIQLGTLIIGGAPTGLPSAAATAVPEPSSIVLLVLAGMMIGWSKFRRR